MPETTTQSRPTFCGATAGATIADQRYILGSGGNDPTRIDTLFCTADTDESLLVVSRIPTPRGNVVATAVGNHLYAIAGILDRAGADRQDSGPCDVVERFDVEQGQWFGCAPLPAARVKPGVAVVDKTIYALGGRQGEDDSSMIFAYDTVADSWSQAGQLPYGARHGAACSWEGKIYYSGGFQAGPNHGTFHQSLTVFDPDSGEVKSLEPMPEARTAHAMLASQGRLFVLGGVDDQKASTSTVFCYDLQQGRWSQAASLSSSRAVFAADMLDSDTAWLAGGWSKIGKIANVSQERCALTFR